MTFLIIVAYFFTIYLLYILFFWKIVFPVKNHVFVIFQNDGEIRGGGGLITVTAEIQTFLGIPYKFRKYSFDDINSYKEEFFSPFSEKLSQHLIFRDTNYSFFQEENIERFTRFYEHTFPKNTLPKTWLIINYSFVENIFRFIPPFKFGIFTIKRSSLFRTLSHMVGDNDLGRDKRKDAIFSLIPRLLILFVIPFFPHIMLIIGRIGIRKRDISILKITEKTSKRKTPYISIVENNLIGRKGNRYIENFLGFDFLVSEVSDKEIVGTGAIRIQKKLFAEDSFPLSGTYRFTLLPIGSEHFSFESTKHMYFEFNPNELFSCEIPFEFHLPRVGGIDILKQTGLQNTNIAINFQTKMFQYLPITSLPIKKDHWHSLCKKFDTNIHFSYGCTEDVSPIRLIHRVILSSGILQLSFQKSVIPSKANFIFTYEDKIIDIKEIITENDGKTLIFFMSDKESVPYYPISERRNVLRVKVSHLQDTTGMIHYGVNHRTIWFPWSETYNG